MVSSKKAIALFVVIMIGVVIGSVFLDEIGSAITQQTGTLNVVNESIDISSARGDDGDANSSISLLIAHRPNTVRNSNQSIENFVLQVKNGTIATNATHYTPFLNNGTFRLENSTTFWSTDADNDTNVDYTYRNSNYVVDSSSRAIINLIIIFGALAVLIFAIVMLLSSELWLKVIGRFS